ncbi:histidine phosphatase family protein [Galbitalea soli]|uniref:Histidine phosphatase family protein n=1 Tax=Galbitalea soli TaxID=1268042 RepID=A0A7C9PLB2_9MICO|nr:histidine phosphatase family protein [Galbitalea soli]NEM90132.1 histidine phosphatase family protein [Galbitalea soli]NYJ30840.1 broad specificity phosphatase PhoE [Galbitalea soli]
MTSLYLVRHGETDWNAARRIQGRTDIPLNDTGRAQALATGRLLATREWDGIYASPLSRARETAEIIAAQIALPAPGIIDAIAERNYGEAEGLGFHEVDAIYAGDVPGRESHEEVVERALPALTELAAAHPGEAIVVVTHGGVIRAVLNHLTPDVNHGPIANGSIHSVRMTEGEFRLVEFNDPLDALAAETATGALDLQNAIERREDTTAH